MNARKSGRHRGITLLLQDVHQHASSVRDHRDTRLLGMNGGRYRVFRTVLGRRMFLAMGLDSPETPTLARRAIGYFMPA
jgi:hypothetical protein